MFFFFFNDTATTEIYTLSLHDALPILDVMARRNDNVKVRTVAGEIGWLDSRALLEAALWERSVKLLDTARGDRKSTRLNSSHLVISYAVFCLKKKKTRHYVRPTHCRHA